MNMYKTAITEIEHRGFTFADISRGTGISQSSLSRWANKKKNFSVDNYEKIFDFLGISLMKVY